MSAPRVAWKAVAERLAGRLANHADCEEHPERKPNRDCPSCDDRAAYTEYLAAGGIDHRMSFSGPSISVFDLRKQHEGSS